VIFEENMLSWLATDVREMLGIDDLESDEISEIHIKF
jgi:hypothetical protein